MDVIVPDRADFPRGLLVWAGHLSGGVKRLFDKTSGRPAGGLLQTHLIFKLEAWARDIASGRINTPRALLLVGGPGNGKTEAIEHTIQVLDEALGANGDLVKYLEKRFRPAEGDAVPRVATVDIGALVPSLGSLSLELVQDGTVTAGGNGQTAAELLVHELSAQVSSDSKKIYLCCVNRGVLDDALVHALEVKNQSACEVIEAITRSVSLSSNAPSCWPLHSHKNFAVWPMDLESLFIVPEGGAIAPAAAMLEFGISAQRWAGNNSCVAGPMCPFCGSQSTLSKGKSKESLLKILRWFELASGKRWSFRDLFTLYSYLLAGHSTATDEHAGDPCVWASGQVQLDKSCQATLTPKNHELTACFKLALSSYQHSLFHSWDKTAWTKIKQYLKDLEIPKTNPEGKLLHGLLHFLNERKKPYLPHSIESPVESLCALFDPALASPDFMVELSNSSSVQIGMIDTRFSRSIGNGIEYLTKYKFLSFAEIELLKRLSKADDYLSDPQVRRKRPTAAGQLQRMLRDFAARLVKRSLCTRSAVVCDYPILHGFQLIVEDDAGSALHEVAKQVGGLLNGKNYFEVSLTTTFGQPLPPQRRQATLVVPKRSVKPMKLTKLGRPRSPISFLEVGLGSSSHAIPLTYDLYKTVKELEKGLSPASLPRNVVALLDTTKSRLSGAIVRDKETIDSSEIMIGSDGTVISKSYEGFIGNRNGIQV